MTGENRRLELTTHKVIWRRIENKTIWIALEPTGLPSEDHLRVETHIAASADEQAARGSLTEGAVSTEDGNPGRVETQHFPSPEIELRRRSWPPNIDDLCSPALYDAYELRVVSQELMEAVYQRNAGLGRVHQVDP